MADDNKRVLDHLGVTAWHAAGWTGTRGLTATGEDVEGSLGNHEQNTMNVFRLIAPERKLIHMPVTANYTGGQYQHRLLDEAVPEIIRQGVDTLYASLIVSSCNVDELNAGLACIADRCSLFFAAGNGDKKSSNRIIQSKYVWGVGAYYLMAGTNEMRPANFSSVSEDVEFAAPTLIGGFSGTSCSTPVLAGMASLVNDMAIAKTGRPLSQAGMYRFLRDCCVDIGDDGRDDKSGWGAPILPDPDTVDIARYQEATMMYHDSADIPAFAREDVELCREQGLLVGDADGNFRPRDNVTRAELACALARLWRKLGGKA